MYIYEDILLRQVIWMLLFISDLTIVPAKHFGDALFHGFLNMLTDGGLTVEESLNVLHWAMFCETEKQPIRDRLTIEDFACSRLDLQE